MVGKKEQESAAEFRHTAGNSLQLALYIVVAWAVTVAI